jgi:hypothetical protein
MTFWHYADQERNDGLIGERNLATFGCARVERGCSAFPPLRFTSRLRSVTGTHSACVQRSARRIM